MDVIYATEDNWGTLTAAKKKQGVSMEDLIMSMRSHLLQDSGGGGGEGAPSTSEHVPVSSSPRPPLCSSPIDTLTVAGTDIIPPPGNGMDFAGDDRVDFTRGEEGEGPDLGFGCQGSQHPNDGQVSWGKGCKTVNWAGVHRYNV